MDKQTAADCGDSMLNLKEAQEAFTNDSAFMIAYERALETERGEDALVNDPFAKQLAGLKGKELSDSFGAAASVSYKLWPEFHKQWTVVRTKFIDDHLERIIKEVKPKELQLVNLGAGLDTRAFRLDSASKLLVVYEVDMEAINVPKAKIFKALNSVPVCERKLVSADLTVEGALKEELAKAGFEPSRGSIFLAEGLLMYLGKAQKQFIRDISSLSAPSSTLILNFLEGHPDLTKKDLVFELEEGGWKNLVFNMYGDDVLNYGRFEMGYKPSPFFSFVVCVKGE